MMNRGHISHAVDSLCKRQFIAAIPDRADRRYVHYEVLDSARDIVAEVTKRREYMRTKILEGISEQELQAFCNVAIKIRKNIDNLL